jgi:hypothetical protein
MTTKRLTLTPDQMDFERPYKDGDSDAVKVKKFIEVDPGAESVWNHNLGRKPAEITITYSNRALNYPEWVRVDAYNAVLKFVPDLVGAYTSKKFILVLRFA